MRSCSSCAIWPRSSARRFCSTTARVPGLIKAFEARINAATDSSQPSIDYPGARSLLGELQAFLPDSLAVKDLEDRLGARENDEIKRLSDRFDDYLKRGLLIDAQGADEHRRRAGGDPQDRCAEPAAQRSATCPARTRSRRRKALQAGNATWRRHWSLRGCHRFKRHHAHGSARSGSACCRCASSCSLAVSRSKARSRRSPWRRPSSQTSTQACRAGRTARHRTRQPGTRERSASGSARSECAGRANS